MYSSDIVANAVRQYWKDNYPQDVVVWLYQKYEHEQFYSLETVVASPDSDSDFETIEFNFDFDEGQTCVEIVRIVPLSEVMEFYFKERIE